MSHSTSIRKNLIAQRQQLSQLEITEKSELICHKILKTNWFLRSRYIAFYMAYNGEVDCSLLIEQAWRMKKQCYLPVLNPVKHNTLLFMHFTPESKMQYNHYGILEPTIKNKHLFAPWSLDCVLTPLVGFDENCNRLGWGVGHYDRTFAFTKTHQLRPKPLLVGLAYDFQKIKKLSAQPWDVTLDSIVTEYKIY